MEDRGATFGFTLFWLWVWLVYQSRVFELDAPYQFGLVYPPWSIPLLAYALTFLVAGALYKSRGIVPRGKYYLGFITTALVSSATISLVLIYATIGSVFADIVLHLTGEILAGVGTALLHMEWGRLMSWFGTRKTIYHCVAATVLAAACLLILNLLPLAIIRCCVLILPIASMLFLARCFRRYPLALRNPKKTVLLIPIKFIITSFVQGLSFGIFLALFLMGDIEQPTLPLSAASFACAALVIFFAVIFIKLDFNQLLYRVGFLIMAVGFLIMGVLSSQGAVSWFIHSIGYRTVDILMWALCAYLVKQRGFHPNWIFSWTGTMLIGQVLGSLIGNAALSNPMNASSGESPPLAIVMVFILLVSALLLYDTKNLRTGWGMAKPDEANVSISAFELACSFVSSEHNLTAREAEVFILLAKGRNRGYICEILLLSKETVKTHVRTIYSKLGVHSQQEAMTLVEVQENFFDQGTDESGTGKMKPSS